MLPFDRKGRVAAIRSFNRFYTRQVGALRGGLLHTPYPLTEARVLFEIAHHKNLTASKLGHELGLDPGYLSRILTRLGRRGLVERIQSKEDARVRYLHLTAHGHEAFAIINQRASEEIAEELDNLNEADQRALLRAMHTIHSILDKTSGLKYGGPFILRDPEPGDFGWVALRHGVLYAQEYGWDVHFEARVAQIVADFIHNFDATREHCWIAEMDGEKVGSVFLIKADKDVARLRLLLVEPEVRGLGLGSRLVEECIRFAKRVGYHKIILMTYSVQVSARKIYQGARFKLVSSKEHHSYGKDLVEENWELTL